MLAIRMKRTGRKGHAQFRLVVQDSRFSPSSGRVVAYLGSYDPHSKVAAFDKDKASQYLKDGAQPSDRVARLLKKEGVKLPTWVKLSAPTKRAIRNPEKLRRNRPVEAAADESQAAKPAEEKTEPTQKPAETPQDSAAEETPAPAPEEESPAEVVEEPTAPKEQATEVPEAPQQEAGDKEKS